MELLKYSFGTLVLWGLFAINGATYVQSAEIIAHRGASFDAPENTISSVKLAWEQGANAVEVDVYLSTDGKVFAIHDKTPKRYGGPDKPVSKMSWDELKKLDVGAWKDEKYRGEKIPLLSELLPLIPKNGRMFIEIKTGPEIIPALKRVLQKANRPCKQTAIICFSEQVIAGVRKELPHLDAYWLSYLKKNQKPGERKTPTIGQVIATAKKLDTTAVDLGGEIAEHDVKQLSAAGLGCYVWTINDPQKARELVNWGVIGITTDRPALMFKNGIGKPRTE